MKPFETKINEFSGGMSLNKKLGAAKQFYQGKQCDFRTLPGYVGMARKMGTMIGYSGSLRFHSFAERAGAYYAWGIDFTKDISNRLFQITTASGGTIMEKHKDSSSEGIHYGNYPIVNFEGNLFYAGQTHVGYWDYAVGYYDTFQTGLPICDRTRGMVIKHGNLYVASRNKIDKITPAPLYYTNVLDLPDEYWTEWLADFWGNYIAMAGDSRKNIKIFFWDVSRANPSWDEEITLPDKHMHAMFWAANRLYVWAGGGGGGEHPKNYINLYEISPDLSYKKIHRFNTKVGRPIFVKQGSVVYQNGLVYFGLSGGWESDDEEITFEENPEGIYSFTPGVYPLDLCLEYDSGSADSDMFWGIGIFNNNSSQLVWSREVRGASTVRYIEKQEEMDADDRYGQGEMISHEYFAPPRSKFILEHFNVEVDKDSDVELLCATDGSSSFTSLGSITSGMKKTFHKHITCDSFQIKAKIGAGAGGTTPQWLRSITVIGHLKTIHDV